MLQTQHSERVTAPHEEYCMTRAHLSPYRDASKQVADKLRFFRGASPGTPPSVCAPSLYLFVGRQTGARVTLCCSQSLCVAARLQSQQKLLFHRTGLLARCVFLRLHICDAKRVSVHEDMELIFFGETSQHTWDNKCHLTSVMFVLIIVCLILELHDAAGSGFFLF